MKLTPEQVEVLQGVIACVNSAGCWVPDDGPIEDELVALGLLTRENGPYIYPTDRGEMPVWAIEHFPTSPEEARGWEPIQFHNAFAMCVLTAAQTRIEGMWAAYIAAVPGICHRDEVDLVLDHGDKLPEAVARAMYPHMEGIPYAR